ncbi:MAG: SDR family oxidoreductase [Solirubrobacterales bacterium]|nr:SDR family oxidoreductase [Solirubrobacterales bacterium]
MTRTAIVTGGAGGIGRAIAAELCARGLRVAVADLDAARAEEAAAAAGGAAAGFAIDVTDTAAVDACAAAVEERLGPVDVVVNNAGWDELRPFAETGEDFWRKVVEINYLGALRVTHRFLPGMVERGWGRVVSTSSDAARVGSSLESVYAGAKAGIVGFSKSLAREVATKGVTANVVCPGPTETPLLEGMVGTDERGAKVIAAMTRAVPMKRLRRPEDVAAAVAYFASEEAGFVTGQTLSVSGGLTMA